MLECWYGNNSQHNQMDSSLPPLPSKGVCAVTSAPEGSRCRNKDAKGAWQVKSLPECREACIGCRFCQFFSYSPQDGDCSWFRECKELKHFGTKHTTHQLRHRNGSILDTSSEHTYRTQQTIKAVVGCKRLVGSSRQGTLRPSATRPQVYHGKTEFERALAWPRSSPQLRFGVPV